MKYYPNICIAKLFSETSPGFSNFVGSNHSPSQSFHGKADEVSLYKILFCFTSIFADRTTGVQTRGVQSVASEMKQ